MFSIRRPAAALCLAAVVVALGTGCGAETSATPSTAPTPAPTDDPTDDPAAAPATHARLVVDPNGGSISCVEKVAKGGLVSLYDPTVRGHGNLTIVSAKIAGNGVRLLDAESVVSLAPVTNGPGALVDDKWPLTLSQTRAGSVDKDTRQPLVGTTVDDGTRILPLISFTVTRPGGARADALVLTYRAEGNPAKRTVRVPLDMTLPVGKCR